MLFADARPGDGYENGELVEFEGVDRGTTSPDECLKSKGAVKCAERVIDRMVKEKEKWKQVEEWRDIDFE